MNTKQHNKASRGAILALSISGVALVGLGAVLGLLAPSLFTGAADRVERLTPSNVAMLEDGRPGREVLVEGHISGRNPVRFQSAVAYLHEGLEIDEDGDTEWVEQDRATPPLLLQLSDGLVRVQNGNYELQLARVIEQGGDTRYQVIETGDAVIAVGTLTSDASPAQIEADFIALGTRVEYIGAQRTAAQAGLASGLSLGALGAVCGLFAGGLWLRTKGRGVSFSRNLRFRR